MTAAQQIFGWLNDVKSNRDLPASCFKVAFQLAQKTNSAVFEKSGQLVTWQSEVTIADAIKMSVRTVRDMASRLQAAGHLKIKNGHGPGDSNRYTLTLKYGQAAAAFDGDNSGGPLPVSGEQMRQSDVSIEAVQRMNRGSGLPPNYSISNSIISATARGPRRAEDALGPLGPKLRELIEPAVFEAWFGKGNARLVSQTDDTVTLAVSSKFFAIQITNRFERHILASASSATRLVMEVH